ncbi:Putative quercetin 2,3-dioxygenase [Burkholderiales bacterium]|nr:Putative quercetin 2,3-dioxygenase [Burkholderiales bacterium]
MNALHSLVEPRDRDLGSFVVRRILPAFPVRAVGPFVFVDHMGPLALPPGEGVDVRPHPHIGLATVTWLWEGALMHRDSLGTVQRIAPGEVNWMSAGRGIVHSERSDAADRARGPRLHGMQTWVALPRGLEESAPSFTHVAASALPVIRHRDAAVTVIAGDAYGHRAPTPTVVDTLFAAVDFAAAGEIPLAADHEERSVYAVDSDLRIDGETVPVHHLGVIEPGRAVTLSAPGPSRAMLIGGAKLDGERLLWWNFVSSSRERIERAKDDWRERRFPGVPGETEFIPLPER